jgi:hypothetical protein
MEAKKEKIHKKDVATAEKTRKPQDELPKTTWQTSPEDQSKSRWNPCALYF